MVAGWKPDPSQRFDLRYHDGSSWTEHVARNGITFTDPYLGDSDALRAPNSAPSARPGYQQLPAFVPFRERTTADRGCAAVVGSAVIVLLIVSVVVALLKGATGGGATTTSHPPSKDVQISRCATDELGNAEMELAILNHSSEASTYLIDVQWQSTDGKVQFGTSVGSVSHLEPGQSTKVSVPSFVTPSGSFVCKVADVTRFAST